jgi:hypothetical protein
MNKWTVRVVGILLLLFFTFLFIDLQRKLVMMQKQQPAPTQRR